MDAGFWGAGRVWLSAAVAKPAASTVARIRARGWCMAGTIRRLAGLLSPAWRMRLPLCARAL